MAVARGLGVFLYKNRPLARFLVCGGLYREEGRRAGGLAHDDVDPRREREAGRKAGRERNCCSPLSLISQQLLGAAAHAGLLVVSEGLLGHVSSR